MIHVTIPLPDDVREVAERIAAEKGITLEALARETLERELRRLDQPWSEDPFFADREVYDGPTPPDLIENLDDYIYGSKG